MSDFLNKTSWKRLTDYGQSIEKHTVNRLFDSNGIERLLSSDIDMLVNAYFERGKLQDTRPKPTKRQGECLNLIKAFIEKENYAPTIRELSDEMKLSVSNIWRFIEGLIKRGYLRKLPGHSRSISIIEFPSYNNVD